MPTSCFCYKGQVKIASLCPASACESFAYISDIGFGHHLIFFPLGNGFSLLRSKIFSFVTSKLKKKKPIVYMCVEKTKTFLLSSFFSGLWQFPVHFPPSSQGLSRTCVKPSETQRSMLFCPRFLLQSP